MEENNNENVKVKRNNNTGIIVILVIIILALGVCVGYLLSKTSNNEETTEVANNTQVQEKSEKTKKDTKIDVNVEYKKAEYSDAEILGKFLINNKDVLNSMLEVTHDSNLKLISKSVSDNMAFVNIDIYGSQFDTKYLFIYDNNGKIITYFHLLNDVDNDNNSYKYNGDFEYDSNNKTLAFSTSIWFGEGEESTGKGFNQKLINELSKSELEKFGNYADKVKYEYKFENGKFELLKKDTLSQVKNNEYYKEYFK